MPQPAAILSPWHEFYALLGAASATMIGLLFVAATVGAGMFTRDRRAAQRVFLSASVVNFSTVLATCLTMVAPVPGWSLLGCIVIVIGVFGLVHACAGCRDTVRDGLLAKIDLEDRTWYIALPIVCYLLVTVSGITLALQWDGGCAALAGSTGLLLAVGVHNAWDITVWSITRRRE